MTVQTVRPSPVSTPVHQEGTGSGWKASAMSVSTSLSVTMSGILPPGVSSVQQGAGATTRNSGDPQLGQGSLSCFSWLHRLQNRAGGTMGRFIWSGMVVFLARPWLAVCGLEGCP